MNLDHVIKHVFAFVALERLLLVGRAKMLAGRNHAQFAHFAFAAAESLEMRLHNVLLELHPGLEAIQIAMPTRNGFVLVDR